MNTSYEETENKKLMIYLIETALVWVSCRTEQEFLTFILNQLNEIKENIPPTTIVVPDLSVITINIVNNSYIFSYSHP